jgi:hypothetical protein
MKATALFAVLLLFFSFAIAQQTAPAANAPGPGDPGYKPGSGTTITVELPRTLDAKKLKQGDELQARVTADLIYNGKVIVPREAKVLGKVEDLKMGEKGDPETRLLLVFEKIVTKDGREFQFEYPAFVQALGPERRAAALSTSNHEDLPVKAELGNAVDRVNSVPFILGDKSSATYGVILPTASGVFALPGLKLSESPKGVYIVAPKGNIKLEYGAQMVLRVATPAK